MKEVNTPKLRTCENGHTYLKISDCPICPTCEEEKKPKNSLLALISAPARRALETVGIDTVEKLSKYTEKEIISLHGMGKSTILKLRAILSEKGLIFYEK